MKTPASVGGAVAVVTLLAFVLKLVDFGNSSKVAGLVPDTWTATGVFVGCCIAVGIGLIALIAWLDDGDRPAPRLRALHYAPRHRRPRRAGRRNQNRPHAKR